MNKKIVLPLVLAAGVLSVVALAAGTNVAVQGAYRSSEGTWIHYGRKEATKTEKGVREYWVNCSTHAYQFTAPEAYVQGGDLDTTGFSATDDRWIYNVTVDADVDMSADTKTIDLGDYDGGTISSMTIGGEDVGTDASNLTMTAFDTNATHGEKDLVVDTIVGGKEYAVYGTATLVTKYIASADDYMNYIVPSSTNTVITGYYKQSADFNITDNVSSITFDWSRYFGGTYNGNGHTLTAKTYSYGVFSQVGGATIKNLTIKDGWAGSWGCIIAKSIYSSTFDNVVINGTAGTNYTKTAVNDSGWVCFGKCQNVAFNNCDFNHKGHSITYVFGYAQNIAGITFSNSTLEVSSITALYYSTYLEGQTTDESVYKPTEAAGLTITLA